MAAARKKLTPKQGDKKKGTRTTTQKTGNKEANATAKSTSAKKPAPKKPAAKSTPAKKAIIKKNVAKKSAARPTPRKSPPRPPPEPGAVEVAHKAAAILFSKKAEDVVLLDLRSLSTVADYYLICTCQNEPQMRAILSTVQRALSREGVKSLRAEYMPGVRWAVLDYSDLILHLFEKQTRRYYSLERLWADAPARQLKPEDYTTLDETDAFEDDEL